MNNFSKTQRLVGTAILFALVIVLQTFSSIIKPGLVPITLALIPIIVGAVMYGASTGAFLGFAFSVIVLIAVLTGADPVHNAFFAIKPVPIVLVCLLKGTLAGFLAGLVASKLSKTNLSLSVIAAAIITPVCNTGVYALCMMLFFKDELMADYGNAAGYTNVFLFIMVAWIGFNFFIELIIDVVLSPVVIRIINTLRHSS